MGIAQGSYVRCDWKFLPMIGRKTVTLDDFAQKLDCALIITRKRTYIERTESPGHIIGGGVSQASRPKKKQAAKLFPCHALFSICSLLAYCL